MSSTRNKLFLPILILGAATLVASILYINRPSPKPAEISHKPLLIDAAKVVKQDIQISVRAQGTVTPRTITDIIAEVSGRVSKVPANFKASGFFREGDMLLEIDDRDYRAALKQAEAKVASAKSNLANEKGLAEVAHQDWLKYNKSVNRTAAANDLALRIPQSSHARAQLDSAEAELDHARDQLDRTIIRAPHEGVIKDKQVDIGQYVNVGTTLATIFAIDTAELRMALPGNKLNYLNLPPLLKEQSPDFEPATVELVARVGGETQQWQGKMVRTEAVFDQRSRILFAVAEVDDPYGIKTARDHVLRIGTFVEASIEGRIIADLTILPRHILRAGNRIWVIDQQQRLQNRQVQTLSTGGEEMYVSAGLSEGELVCLSNISGAIPGTAVRLASVTASNELFGDENAEQPLEIDETIELEQPAFDRPNINIGQPAIEQSPLEIAPAAKQDQTPADSSKDHAA